jgi:DNA-binding NtrC family response regulator/CHASE2 domain-containing sensor protein
MAHATVTHRTVLAAAVAAAAALLLVFFLQRPMSAFEDEVTTLRYRVRGDRTADTNIVLVYIDEAAIKVTGWPVRRNFHALMLKALTDLRVRAVGIELLLEDQRPEYPEYDDLLASVMSASSPAVLTCYFDSLVVSTPDSSGESYLHPVPSYPAVVTPELQGHGVHLPVDEFRAAAAGFGHVNFSREGRIPVFAGYAGTAIPSFSLELARVSTGVERPGIQFDGERVGMRHGARHIDFATEGAGEVTPNYPGPLSAFTTISFLDVLRAYDMERTGLQAPLPILRLRDKIVLVGVVAEGRGALYNTPVDPRLPSLGIHAAFLDNAMGSGFQRTAPRWVVMLVSLLVALLCAGAVMLFAPPRDKIVPAVLLVLVAAGSFPLFAWTGVVFPVLPVLFVGGAATIAGLISRHRITRGQVDTLGAEKNAVLAELRDKEAKLAMLERELLNYQLSHTADRTQELLEEIRKHKAEIRSLSSRADDMEEFAAPAGPDVRAEFEGLIYAKNSPLSAAAVLVEKIASSDAPVLILGESGTGKELVARALHRRSARSAKPFVAVNCGALSETLLESELFGHEKGAFTGAVKEKMGRFELADGGTIFLDEIGEVSDGFQVKLLRVLQEGEVERVGGTRTLRLDVRVVAATNRDLREQVKSKKFREDLYYRLNVLTVSLSPLRERQDDIPLLIDHFLKKEGGGLRVSKNVVEALREYPWPGNVRELESVMRRCAVMARAEQRELVHLQDLPGELAEGMKGRIPIQEQILDLMREFRFSRSAVSEAAVGLGGLNRGTVAEYLRGEFLKAFAEQQFDLSRAVMHVSLSSDPAMNDRVRKRYLEYLQNIADGMDLSHPWEEVRNGLKPKMKNLPQRYHVFLEQVAEAYFRRVWTLPTSA